MTRATLDLALARLAAAEADAAFEAGNDSGGAYFLDLADRLADGQDVQACLDADEWLAGRDRSTSGAPPPPPDPTWADLGV